MAAEQISRYPVVRSLGSGGMGRVYLARDPDLDRDVALKVLKRQYGEDREAAVARLRGEARAVAALRHPNIITIYEIGDDGERAFIAMEYVEGASLRARIDEGIEDAELLAAGAKVARALEAAHAAGVLHRDIKPDNVMVDGNSVIKVVDFGIAHRLDGEVAAPPDATTRRIDVIAATIAQTLPQQSPMATAQTIFGTPAYMSPEVALGQAPLPASDVYSLGVTLYEGLAGHLPYSDVSVLESLVLCADPDEPFKPLADSRPDLAPEVVELIEAMLAHEPQRRPGAAAVADALEAIGAPTTEPVEVVRATPEPPAPSRTPWLVAGAGLLLAALAITVLAINQRAGEADPAGAGGARAPASEPLRLAVADVDGNYANLGHASLGPNGVAEVLARALDVSPALEPIVLSPDAGAPPDAARAAGATHLLTAEIELGEETARGRFAIVDLDDPGATRRGAIRSDDLAGAITELARASLTELGVDPPKNQSETVARVSFELGLGAYRRERWPAARLFLEQAVVASPDLPSAWFYLTWARGWVGAPAAKTREAAQRALETARTDLERGLGRAIIAFNDKRYRRAAEILEPLLEGNGRDRDLLYTYAEALYHDGRIEDALEYFDRCLQVAPRFLPAARHPRQIAVANKDTTAYRRYQLLSGEPYEGMVAYLGGDLEAARRAGFAPSWLPLVLGNFGGHDRTHARRRSARSLAYVMGRAAQLGTQAAARALFTRAWPEISAAAETPRGAFDLQILARALVMGGYDREVGLVKRWWDEHQTPVNLMARQELAVFAAPLLDTPLPPTDELTTRLGKVAEAIDAMRGGRSARAADLLGELAANPDGRGGDFVIWHAWARALRAAGRTDELREACEHWRRPGFADLSIVSLWAYCDRALR